MIQIRNVPDEIHRALKIQSAEEGMTLSDFLLKEVTDIVNRPTIESIISTIKSRERVILSEDSVQAVRREHDSRK
jgi:hypothetical protein